MDAIKDLLSGPGFLGTNAPLLSDISLVLVLLTAVMFTVGRRLALARRYEAHRRVQTAAVIVNSAFVIGVMVNSFRTHILPGVPSKLLEGDYGVTTVHALIGTAALLLGAFVTLRGNNLVPRALAFKNYKPFMRSAYTLYMIATALGVVVYVLPFVFGI